MVILVNFSQNPFKVQYRDGSKALVKVIPSNKIVAMKGLRVSEQITNRAALAKQNITIYDYERGTYYHNNGASFDGLPFTFIGNNVKQNSIGNISLGFTGSTSVSGATFTQADATTSTIYGFIITANTEGTVGIITATTVGNDTYIGFKGNTTSLELVTGLTSYAGFTALGVDVTGGDTTAISASTFYLSATTTYPSSVLYSYLQGLV